MQALHQERRIGNPRIPISIAADSKLGGFSRYGPMDRHEVRGLKVEGTELERLRARREMLRSMTPEKALEVIEFHKGLNLFQALALAKKEGRLIVPNDVHDKILIETKDEEYLRQNYPVWTGTLVIYEAPGKPFGEQLVFQGINFKVSTQFRGKVNCALVIEHPDFDLVDLGSNRYELKAADENIHLVKRFPKNSGLYMSHAEIGVPHGEKVEASLDARYLHRLNDSSYVGLLVSFVLDFHYRGRDVFADFRYDYAFGVALLPFAAAER